MGRLLWQMVAHDLRARYAGSLLGLFWNVIHPLIMVGIYTLVFSRVIGARLETGNHDIYAFSIYLCAALLPWNGFSEVVKRSTSVFLDNANLVKKVAFPRFFLHLHLLLGAAINAGIVTIIFLGFLLLAGRSPSPGALLVWLVFMLLELLLGAGIGLFASTLNVFFRDVDQIVTIVLQIWFWLTPIVYVAAVLPEPARRLMRFNPLYHLARIQQQLLLAGTFPEAGRTALLFLLPLVLIPAGLGFYRLLRFRIPDEL
ncbi:MAG: ABC transporter permease [Acidobacteriota bacterium]